MAVFILFKFLITFILIAGGLLLLALLISWITYYIAFHSPRKGQNDPYNLPNSEQYQASREGMLTLVRELDAVPYEQVYITSDDGLKLAGRYYHRKDGAPLDIGFHGYRGTAVRDFCGGSKISFDEGHNVLLVDQRAQGKSEGHTITFGIMEQQDCLCWIRYANGRFGENIPITLYGVSMGASTVLMASELELPKNIRCIIADCPYSTAEAIIRKVCGDMGFPHRLVYPFIKLGARIFGGIRLSEGNAVEAVKHAKIPILIIHGEEDLFVPCSMSEEVYKANSEWVERHTFPASGHGLSYVTDTRRYEEAVKEFIRRYTE